MHFLHAILIYKDSKEVWNLKVINKKFGVINIFLTNFNPFPSFF